MQTGESAFTNFRNFIGVVEDRNDPQELGRLKVRAYSIHSEDNTLVPTDDLPWAMVVQPITSAAISGIGRSPTGIVEGTWVYGVFMDEGEFQQPLVIGTLVGKPSNLPSDTGFSDSKNEVYPLDNPAISSIGESSVSRLARKNAESHQVLTKKRKNKDDLGTIESAKGSKVRSVLANKDKSFYRRTKWKEPHPRYGGQGRNFPPEVPTSAYPLNHVWHTEAGHVFEVDDTPKAERIHWYHNSGTFQEIQPKGDRMTKVVGNNYEVIFGEKDMYVKGNVNITFGTPLNNLLDNINFDEKLNKIVQQVTQILDREIILNYHLTDVNHAAYDLLNNKTTIEQLPENLQEFKNRYEKLNDAPPEYRKIWLEMYANPVKNKLKLKQADENH